VGFVTLSGGMFAVGTLALSPPRVDVAPLDGLGHRDANRGFAIASDWVTGGGLALSAVLGLATEIDRGASGSDLLRAPLILAESALVTAGVVGMVKNLVGACRPWAWSDGERRCVGARPGEPVNEDRSSFPSGHTAPLAAMAGASLGMLFLPDHHRGEYVPLVLVTSGLALTAMTLRVVAGAHSWVDTGTSLLLGGVLGFATSWLHVRSGPAVNLGLSTGSSGITVGGVW